MRCKCCNVILSEMERMSKIRFEDDKGNSFEHYDDLCFNCRTDSLVIETYVNREYTFNDLTEGLSTPSGFSDTY